MRVLCKYGRGGYMTTHQKGTFYSAKSPIGGLYVFEADDGRGGWEARVFAPREGSVVIARSGTPQTAANIAVRWIDAAAKAARRAK